MSEPKSITESDMDRAGMILDDLDSLPDKQRARVLMNILRKLVWRANSDDILFPEDILECVREAAGPYKCA